MEKAPYIAVFITASAEDADKLAHLLVEKRKAACVNILPGVDSLYWWGGKIESARESLLIVKTKASLLPDLITLVKSAHSYTVPEIIALPIIGGNLDYLDWIERSVS